MTDAAELHDAAHWDARYAADGHQPAEPRATRGPVPALAEVATDLTSGRALDLGAGQGRNALWLARLGWVVTAVDFSAVGIDQARSAQPVGVAVDWVVADVRQWAPGAHATPYDLVLCSYLHLDPADFARVRSWLAPGGRLVVVGPGPAAAEEPASGPSNPAYRYSEDQLREAATDLVVERLTETAGILTLVARQP